MSESKSVHRNRLADETSPYLLQHASNPVDWYPWGEEAFARARAEDKPILLSVGYSACHWCHVMAHESFENEETAALMNKMYVNVKVDREERPDVDGVYMAAVQAISGNGGWPMTVFMTPDGEPFYAGTYFPPDDGHGRPGFPRVLASLHEAWKNDRENLMSSATNIAEHLRSYGQREAADSIPLTPEWPAAAVNGMSSLFDREFGGFGNAPKFPSPGNLEFLLAYHARVSRNDAEDIEALTMVLHTLRAMASGGMYDQLGGGFSRYSVDQGWVVPHFEKMLYDNAQLARVYTHALQLTGDPLYEDVVRETLAYLQREMLHPAGGFYAAQDADSEGIEGKFFVWTLGEVQRLLGKDGLLAAACFGVTPEGNFRDPHHPELAYRNVLTRRYDREAVSARFDLSAEEIEAKLEELRETMFRARESRVKPGLDDKILTSWNGIALGAFAEAARVFNDAGYRAVAERNASFIRENLWQNGRLLHTWKDGHARIDGMLEDYAYLGLGLVELFKLTGDIAHLHWARDLMQGIVNEFRDEDSGGFFETSANAEKLLLRQKSWFDAATPSGNGAAALLALWLSRYYSRTDWEDLATEVLRQTADMMAGAPTGFGTLWQCVEFLLAPHQELVITGDAVARAPLEEAIAGYFLPFIAIGPTSSGDGLPMFEGREPREVALAYLCENMACRSPAATAEEIAAQLDPGNDEPFTLFTAQH